MKRLLWGLCGALLSFGAWCAEFGVNIHQGGGNLTDNSQVATVMRDRNLTRARVDLIWNADKTMLRDQITKIRANGGKVEGVLMTAFQWDNSCNQNLAAVESTAYNQASGVVNAMKDVIYDFEMLNEVQLRPEINNASTGVVWNSAGTNPAPYYGKPCVASLTAALKGISQAVRDYRTWTGLPLRVTMGALGRDWGLLTYLRDNGVQWDVTGYHNYPHENTASLLNDPWYGPGGPLYQLAQFGKPVSFNEFNCGEIYDGDYVNTAWTTKYEACLRALDKHLLDLRNQQIANIESLIIYELLDEPSKAGPEGRFGLMYNLTSPKVHFFLVTAYAGGCLSSGAKSELINRGLLTDAEITAMSKCGTYSTAATEEPAPVVTEPVVPVPPVPVCTNRGKKCR